MTHRLATNYAKNYCNRTPIVKVVVENVVTCFFGTQCRAAFDWLVGQSVIDDTIDQWRSRLRVCIRAKGTFGTVFATYIL